jgi:branched-chain amino acid transport system substrate-binding protein
MRSISRRKALQVVAASAAFSATPSFIRAQPAPIKLGSLTPLTGAGGPYGPLMRDAIAGAIKEVNAAGGVLGRQVELISEDEQSSPEPAVRAAHKLIDVDRVAAIMGTWVSAVTTAVAPLCWESKTFLTTCSGADTITQLPHQGYLIRTQPNSNLQFRVLTEFMLAEGAQRIGYLGPQTPYINTARDLITNLTKAAGKSFTQVVYEADKTSYRSEVDQMLRSNPDFLVLAGYAPDTTVLLPDLYRAGYQGKMITLSYALTTKVLQALPHETTDGVYVFQPSPAVGGTAYQRVQKILNRTDIDPYTAQAYDQANLVLLALAQGNGATGTVIRDNVRKSKQAGGTVIDNAADGIALIAKGKPIDYSGASGPCQFNEIGDIITSKFRYDRVKNGAYELVKIA